ncbi:phage holin family protein [Paenibacillus solisilvae]|uniref:Phage holin family protein n=1 Tax=Paenibacillus solisilvae TaxID=2486751 RepID=A0ABW0W132_9BACL
MEWSAITNLIDPSLFLVIAACWVIGYILKQTPKVPDWTIIYAVTAFSITVTLFMLGFHVRSVLQGILCGAAAVYGHQLLRQTREGMGGSGSRRKEDS